MDPLACWNTICELGRRVHHQLTTGAHLRDVSDELQEIEERVEDLEDWLRGGGFSPEAAGRDTAEWIAELEEWDDGRKDAYHALVARLRDLATSCGMVVRKAARHPGAPEEEASPETSSLFGKR